ncbi:MAG: hypothetical protein NTX91_05785 [candidate division SR1 bacterium]|nr:hypothetical protein [candidate division SR1 bacterium]
MKNQSFDIVVKKLMKLKGKLIDIKKIGDILSNVHDESTQQKVYKMVYYLKNRGYLCTIKKNIFLVKDPEATISDEFIIDRFYRQLVKKHCREFLSSTRYIGGVKALELNLSSFDAPDELLICNQTKQATEVIMLQKQIVFKTYSKAKEKGNLFTFFNSMTKKIAVHGIQFPVACLELSILESLYNPSMVSQGYVNELVKKVLRKQRKSLDITIRASILKKNKHHTSINRLHALAKTIDQTLADKIKAIIKKYGYFIS